MARDLSSPQASLRHNFEALASRLVPLIEKNADLLAVLDYAAGALLCLMEAERCGFRDRPGACEPNYQSQVVKAVKEMQDGKTPEANVWIAGWHFNSALVRIAASYDRARGALTRAQRQGQGASPMAVTRQTQAKIKKIRREVNTLKHECDANAPGRSVQFHEALGGFEELLDLIAQYPACPKGL